MVLHVDDRQFFQQFLILQEQLDGLAGDRKGLVHFHPDDGVEPERIEILAWLQMFYIIAPLEQEAPFVIANPNHGASSLTKDCSANSAFWGILPGNLAEPGMRRRSPARVRSLKAKEAEERVLPPASPSEAPEARTDRPLRPPDCKAPSPGVTSGDATEDSAKSADVE